MKLPHPAPASLPFQIQLHRYKLDSLIALSLATIVAVAVYWLEQLVNPVIGSWFQGDLARVFETMTLLGNPYRRNAPHPLFLSIAHPPTALLHSVFHLEEVIAARLVLAAIAAVWISLLFIFLRLIGCRRLDAILLSGLGITSAASIFWLTVPETYSLGSISILLAACLLMLSSQRQMPMYSYVLVGILTLGITVTNFMFGLLTVRLTQNWQTFRRITISILSLTLVWWSIQTTVTAFESAVFHQKVQHQLQTLQHKIELSGNWAVAIAFLIVALLACFGIILRSHKLRKILYQGHKILYIATIFGFVSGFFYLAHGESRFLMQSQSGGAWHILSSFVAHTMVMPAIQLSNRTNEKLMVTQLSLPGSASSWGAIATLLWIMLLSLSLWAFFIFRQQPKLKLFLGLGLAGQLGLHLLYGEETFLYSLHFLPLFLGLVALSTLTRARVISLVLVSLLIVTDGINNIEQFYQATAIANRLLQP